MLSVYLLLVLVMAAGAFIAGRSRGKALAGDGTRLHSLPAYHGLFTASATIIPMVALLVLWGIAAPRLVEYFAIAALPADLQPADEMARGSVLRDIQMAADGFGEPSPALEAAGATYAAWRTGLDVGLLVLGGAFGLSGAWWARSRLGPLFRARNRFESVVKVVLIACSAVAILTTIGIVFSVLFETLRFFARYPVFDFLFGLQWSPQTAIREDQVGSSGAFGAVPLFAGTTLIMLIAMLVAGPIGLFSAIYMAEYASPRV
ncbi:MAG TPA: phosphate ABC transporter permease family protein, partial [Bauldia sp.]|nr:phosphate ABC transporter permease family protein [Bauldia sp.]